MVLKRARAKIRTKPDNPIAPPGAEYLNTNKELVEYRKKVFAKLPKQMDEYYDGFDNCVTAVGLRAKSFDLPQPEVTVIA